MTGLVVAKQPLFVPKSAVPPKARWVAPGVGRNIVGYITDAPTPEGVPTPVGFRIVVQVFEINQQTSSGLFVADQTREGEKVLAMMGRVVAMGRDVYKDAEKFPHGPWCKLGDAVMLAMHTGQKFCVHGVSMRVCNDDEVLAVVDEPNAISRG